MRACRVCGAAFRARANKEIAWLYGRHTCTKECGESYARAKARGYYENACGEPETRYCLKCRMPFTTRNLQRRYCEAHKRGAIQAPIGGRLSVSDYKKQPGYKIQKNWWMVVNRNKTYSGSLEEWAYYREREDMRRFGVKAMRDRERERIAGKESSIVLLPT